MVDTCVLITFGNVHALDVVTELQLYNVVTTQRVIDEVVRPPASDAVDAAVQVGTLSVTTIDLTDAAEQANLVRFDAMPAFRNRADAEVLALGASREYAVCSDEIAIRNAAITELGPEMVAGTPDLMVWAVREQRLTADEGEALVPKLDVGPALLDRIEKDGKTLRELLEN